MLDILIATLLTIPIVAGAGYLLRQYPRQTIILASEAALYAAPVAGWMAITLVLAPATAPVWLQVLSVASFAAVALGLAPYAARRMVRRLTTAEAERRERERDRPA